MSFVINNYSDQLELEHYRQSGNICTFLNISMIAKSSIMDKELTEKFAAFEAAGFRLSSNSLLELLFPSIPRQFTVARCANEFMIMQINSKDYKDAFALKEAKGVVLFSELHHLIVPSSVAILAVLFNISLLIVTARKISMSTLCNWLLAFDSLCQIPALAPFLVNFLAFSFYARLDSVDSNVCLISLMLSIGFSYASFLAIYFMSLERLLFMILPMKMSLINPKTVKRLSLLSFLACTCFGGAMTMLTFNVWTIIYIPFESSFYCNYGFYADALNIHQITHAILGLALLNYVLIVGLIIWKRIYVPMTRADSNNNAAYSQATHRMLRSVSLISLVLLIGWLTGAVLRNQIVQANSTLSTPKNALFVDNSIVLSPSRFGYSLKKWAIALITCLYPAAAGINAPVLIINNSEYRKAYKKALASLLPCRKNTQSSAVVGPLFTN